LVDIIETYYELMINEKLFSSIGNLKFYLNDFFKGIDLNDKVVLDIGGGSGLLSFYAVVCGAKYVICLEPEAEGSISGENAIFDKIKAQLDLRNIQLVTLTFQEYSKTDMVFDIVILKDSVNHLNEPACISLLTDIEAQRTYYEIFRDLYNLCNECAIIIFSDTSRYNIFPFFKLRNIFAPSIEWHKHQSPRLWIKLLNKAGFANAKIKWTSFSYLRNFGKILFGNKFMAYFFKSYFCITMEKVERND